MHHIGSHNTQDTDLMPFALTPLPLGSIRPKGWLLMQLQLQAAGLTGHLDEFWPDVGSDSAWLGGSGEAWERGPYYLDGLLPLAYLLENSTLIAKSTHWIESILSSQKDNGWFGPPRNKDDVWARMIVLKALTQYADATGDVRVMSFMRRYFANQKSALLDLPAETWRGVRYADNVLSIYWLYRQTGEKELLELANAQFKAGFDWIEWFNRFPYKEKIHKPEMRLENHGVNIAMALKNPAVRYQFSHADEDRQAVYTALENLDRYHGQVTGLFSADEHLAGRNPSQGTELCAVVEYMFSLENMIAVLGDASLGDRLEQITFNALPATITADMWAHQYDQQANQVLCTIADRQWASNGPESNIFGLEPNFGCCTANLHQGWPKFTTHLWMSTPDGGLAAVAYAPSSVTSTVREGISVTINEETNYPFEGIIHLELGLKKQAAFPIWLRHPGWAETQHIYVNSRLVENGSQKPGFIVLNRSWAPGDKITIEMPMELKAEQRSPGSIAVKRGPLVMALRIKEDWSQIRGTAPHADYEVKPASAWNYGLVLEPDGSIKAQEVILRTPDSIPWRNDDPPIEIKVRGMLVPEWELVQSSAGALPDHPIASNKPEEKLTLIPYGCARLRISEFPVIKK